MVFILILSCTSIQSKSQSDKGFSDIELRKIAYIIQCKKFLEDDIMSHKKRMAIMSRKYDLLEEKYNSLNKSYEECNDYSDFLYKGSISLIKNTSSLSKENKRLNRKLKLNNYSIPVYVGIGFITATLLLK